ncbi:MAG: class I SAM-dependent methyltransferase [bacterium]
MVPVNLDRDVPPLSRDLEDFAQSIKGFMPPEEGRALYRAGYTAASQGPLLEVGTYCGKSALYFGAAARKNNEKVFTIDHHRGSEENQPGWEHHDPEVVDDRTGEIDTLPFFRRNIYDAGLEDTVIGIVGDSIDVAERWETSLALVFIDGGHGEEPAHNDYENWSPKVRPGGLLLIHDVFEDPEEGGRPPYEIFCRAIDSGNFEEVSRTGSLRILRKTPENDTMS